MVLLLDMLHLTLQWKSLKVVGYMSMGLRLEDRRGGMDLEVTRKSKIFKPMTLGESAGSEGEN